MLKKRLAEEIQLTLDEMMVNTGHVKLEQPQHAEHGDYSTNIAMQLAKALRKAPMQIAQDIVNSLNKRDSFHRMIHKVEVLPPGFINFFLSWEAFTQVEESFTPHKENQRIKVVIEHTSINPNKAAHIGHLRNSCIGDMLVRLHRFMGYSVEVHNYIDDLGNQLADTVVGLLHVPLKKSYDRFGDYCWDLYSQVNREYQQDEELQQRRPEVLHALEEGDTNIAWLGSLVAEKIVREHVEEMAEFNIHYDLLVWEKNIVQSGFWNAAFELLKKSDRFVREEEGKLAGCWVLKQSEEEGAFEEDHYNQDKVLVRSNGILTYTAKDIAYHLWKFGLFAQDFSYRPFDHELWTTARSGESALYGRAHKVLNVIDKRQEYPQHMVKLALEVLGYNQAAENLKHISYGVVSLSPGTAETLGIDTSEKKSSYAMSGRQGIGIKISDLLSHMEQVIEEKRTRKSGLPSREIAIAAVRYYLLRFALNTEIVFDMQQASEVSGNTGVYLLYGYARGFNILRKAEASHISPPSQVDMEQLHETERALLRHLVLWPEVLETALEDMTPNSICQYAFELASFFNHFYASCPVLQEEAKEKRQLRLWLTSVYVKKMEEAFQIIGLPIATEM